MLLMSKGSKEALTVLIVTHFTHVERVERSLNSSYCYSCYSCRKGRKITLCTQYRYIQCYVKRVERLCYVEKKDIHILLITSLIFNGFSIRKKFWKAETQTFPTIPSNTMYVERVESYFDPFNMLRHTLHWMVWLERS